MKRRAFTLLEALIAVAMIGLLAGALAIFVDDLATTRAHVTRTTDRARSADAVFGVVEAALQTAVVDGGRMGAGVSGGPDGLRVLSSRTDAVGSTGAQLSRAAFAPLVATEVRQSGQGILVGRAGVASALPGSACTVRFRYFDGTQWSDWFDSLQAGRLPVMVEVAVWFSAVGASAEDAGAAESEEGGNASGASRSGSAAADAALAADAEETLPPPDRVRRFAVPDAAAPAPEGGSAAGGAP